MTGPADVGTGGEDLPARVRHHRRNTLLLGAVEVGWGPAMAFLDPTSILPVLLQRLGAGTTLLSVLPAIWYGASFPFELASPFATERLPRKRILVWGLHCLIPLVWASVGLWLAFGEVTPGPRALAIVYAGYFLSTALTGFLIPLWYDYMGKITDPRRRGSAFSTIFALQSVAGLGGAFVAQRVLSAAGVDASAGLAPPRFALCYFLAAATAMLGNQAFLWTKEDEPSGHAAPRPRIAEYLASLRDFLKQDRTLRRYVAARAVTRLAPILATYYSVQALARFGPATPVAYFALALIAGKLGTSLLSWRLADSIGMKPFLVGGVLALTLAGGLLVALESGAAASLGLAPYFLVAFLLGIFLMTDGSANATFVMNLAPEDKRASYLTTVNGTLFPLTASVPILAARIAEGAGLVPVQAAATVAFALAAAILALGVPERRPAAA